jgi:hypothetical protein
MTFNIGHQNAGIINNVGRDQHVSGGQHGHPVTTEDAGHALGELRLALAASGLAEPMASAAHTLAAELDAALSARQPDRPRFGAALEGLARLLAATGSLVTAGAALTGPLHTLASWLGAAGEPVLRLLAVT